VPGFCLLIAASVAPSSSSPPRAILFRKLGFESETFRGETIYGKWYMKVFQRIFGGQAEVVDNSSIPWSCLIFRKYALPSSISDRSREAKFEGTAAYSRNSIS